ncbi:MAG: membrane dipeptidase [Clostridia bacterium]|nr:membrane dipeptidase [Clostridia bacterium]
MSLSYCDLHCDTLTVCKDNGLNLADCRLQTDINALKRAGCTAQCFAIFTENKSEEKFFSYADFFINQMYSCSNIAEPIKAKGDFCRIVKSGKLACILTAENLGFLNGGLSGIARIADVGVKVASLVWNTLNAFALPNVVYKNGVPDFACREQKGLTAEGKSTVEILNSCGILLDVSHLSDGGTADVLSISKLPVIASHSNAYSVCPVCRNLTDMQIRAIADSGGIIGVNFCRDFLGNGDIFGLILAHLKHIINVGGEDVAAFGSDYDGMPAPAGLETCSSMPYLLNFLEGKLGGRVTEKVASGNFITLFSHYF